jgi:dipeptidyl-peptidase-4
LRPAISPDNRWVVYRSVDGLYVSPVPATGETIKVAPLDATEPLWSPRGDAIAFSSFDESAVTDFPIQNFLARVDTVEHQRYPLAGGKNPRVSLRLADLRAGTVRTLYDGAPRDEYVLSFAWTPDGRAVVDEILDRAQRHLRLVRFPRAGGAPAVLARVDDPVFVDLPAPPRFLRDGRFLWLSDRGGVRGLDLVDPARGTVRRLSGAYAVGRLLRVDEAAGAAYVSARYPARRQRALLRLPLAGGPARNLTPEPGTHTVTLSERGDGFIDAFSSLTTPPRVERRSLRGGPAATLFATPSLARFDLGTTRVLQVPSRWGPLDAYLIEPPGFDPAKRYPVVVETYGGPLPVGYDEPSDDAWPGLYDHLLAEHGFLVFTVDGPASRFDRSADARRFAGSMGEIALAGQLAGVDWLRRQPFVDAKRLGLFGWSYGGYLTAFALTRAPDVFRAGIAGAPVADWRFYDSAYTERYLGLPQHRPGVYARTAVLPAAGNLRARLLMVQGSADDNVHLSNSVKLLDAFVRAGRQVDYFVYPGARHGLDGIAANRNLDAKMLRWWETNLK